MPRPPRFWPSVLLAMVHGLGWSMLMVGLHKALHTPGWCFVVSTFLGAAAVGSETTARRWRRYRRRLGEWELARIIDRDSRRIRVEPIRDPHA